MRVPFGSCTRFYKIVVVLSVDVLDYVYQVAVTLVAIVVHSRAVPME